MRRRQVALHARAVPAAFDDAAASYDALVAADPGYHRHLRASARRMGLPGNGDGLKILDAGCGTGASTGAVLNAAPLAQVVAVDASEQMLRRARRKTWPPSVRFAHCRVEDLAGAGEDGPFDAVFAAYLVRNLDDPDGQLRAFRRLLRPGGRLVVHEFSVRDSVRARAVWNLVCWTVIIPAGTAASGSSALYRYLWRSVRAFDGVERLQRRLLDCGFTDVEVRTVPGWQRHVVHTFLARAPSGNPADA
ncbi:methyltransferase domain-containing protein [Saccharopolyspora aridisoli]|uniref:Methyltransferase domain-containing protein n=1 Tax=Saccharopolyspora aridisoli TaxID=2530385 RepID=A0A4R4V4P3_9PSEU|nr:class I SAM-dependent methyltransferase [Saccharopolyspora aridisoli]TDC96694.1 methyltransferase domain-containing protein [Saccharopolyspora aridisoli]